MAASSIRSLLHSLPTIQTTNPSNGHCPLLSFSPSIFFESKTLSLKTVALKPQCSFLFSRLSSSSSSSFAAPYVETDDEEYENEDGEDEELEEEEEEEGGENGSPNSPRPRGEDRRLYVGNLAYSITSDDLAELFSQAGTVEGAEVIYDRVTDRSRGFAFVTMTNRDDARAAIRMFDATLLAGRTLRVNFPEVPRGGEREVMGLRIRSSSSGYVDSPHKVYCGNLAWSVTSESLKDAFSDQPGVLGAKVIYEHLSGRSRGFGFVSFASAEDAQSALDQMNGKELKGRPLRLNHASERSPGASTS